MSDLALVTLATVQTELAIEDGGDDARINKLIPAVSRDVEDYCKRELKTATGLVEVLDGSGLDSIAVRRPPINTLTSVHMTTAVPRVFDADHLIDADKYEFDADAGIVWLIDGRWFLEGRNSVRVEYDGGLWSTTSEVPEDVQRAVVEIIQVKLSKGKEKQYHLTSEGREGGSLGGIRFDDIPDHAREVLDRYRLRR